MILQRVLKVGIFWDVYIPVKMMSKKPRMPLPKPISFKPDDEQFAVNYAHSLWQINKQQFNPETTGIFDTLLKNNPNQPDALAMLAMDAFLSHAYEDAIDYWQRLLHLAPEQSEEAKPYEKRLLKHRNILI